MRHSRIEILHLNDNDNGNDKTKTHERELQQDQKQQQKQRQQRQRHNGVCLQKKFLSVLLTAPTLLFMALSCLLLHQPCSGNKDSSFRRPPPPPPPPSTSSSARTIFSAATGTNDGGENVIGNGNYNDNYNDNYNANGGDYYNTQQQQQQQFPSSSSQYPDEYYNSGEPPKVPRESDPSSSMPEQQEPQKQQAPSMPIHYDFPIADDDTGMDEKRGGPQQQRTDNKSDFDFDDSNNRDDDIDMPSTTSSARKDLVTRYWSSKAGKVQIQSVIGLIGYGSGSFMAKSLIGGPDTIRWTGYLWATFLVISTWFRTPLGELSRAVGLSLILVLQRTQRIRREYPTWRYVAASVGMIRGGLRDARGTPRGPRPFPPARNPWKYTPRSPRDPDFNMMYALVSMAMVGSTVGGNMPFIPNWIGALIGAATFAFACTWQNSARGDLARTMGMRVVRAVSELWEIQADLQIIPKATVVSSQMIDKAMILDRKHRVKDRFLSFANKGYAQASKVAEQIQQQQRGGKNKDNDKNDRDRDRDSDRRRDEDDDRRRGGGRRRGGRDRDEEDDRKFEQRDNRRERPNNDDDDGDRNYSRSRVGSEERRQPRRRYDDDDNNDGDFTRRRDNDGDDRKRSDFGNFDDEDRDRSRRPARDDDSFDEKEEAEKKSKGFFFKRK